LWFRVQGSGFRVQGSGSRVSRPGLTPDVEVVASRQQAFRGLQRVQVRACPIRNREDQLLPGQPLEVNDVRILKALLLNLCQSRGRSHCRP